MKPTKRLRQMINEGRTVWTAGAYDALSARLIAEAGFDAILTRRRWASQASAAG